MHGGIRLTGAFVDDTQTQITGEEERSGSSLDEADLSFVLPDLDEDLHIDVRSYMNDLVERERFSEAGSHAVMSGEKDEESFERMLHRVRRMAGECSESMVSPELTALARTMPDHVIDVVGREDGTSDGVDAATSEDVAENDVTSEGAALAGTSSRARRERRRASASTRAASASRRGRHRRAEKAPDARKRKSSRHAAPKRTFPGAAVVLAACAALLVVICVVML